MITTRIYLSSLTLVCCLVLCSVSQAAVTFSDGFEGTTLNPFWSTQEQSGTITLSSAQAHSGSQSAQFSSTYGTGQKEIRLYHEFGEAMYGTAAIWVYDTGADVGSSNYFAFQLMNSNLDTGCYVGTYDYDLGSPGSGSTYRYGYPGQVGGAISAIDRTTAWHHIEFTMTESVSSVTLDGNALYSGAGGTTFDAIRIRMYGPTWRPAFTSYWDDFSIDAYEASPVPAPGAVLLAGLGTGLVGWLRRRRSV